MTELEVKQVVDLVKAGLDENQINTVLGMIKPQEQEVVAENKTEAEVKTTEENIVKAGLTLDNVVGIEQAEQKEDSHKATNDEVIAYMKTLDAKIESLKVAQQVANTQSMIAVEPEDVSGADVLRAYAVE